MGTLAVASTNNTPASQPVVSPIIQQEITIPSQTTTNEKSNSNIEEQKTSEKQNVKTSPSIQTSSDLSNDNYYTNVDGNQVHSPAYSDSVPTGASARCRDGTYSFSQNRSGTCSRHGGVASWL